jgi:hypothetical protein
LAVAVPYLVIVVAMGYTRQGIALGLAMLGLVALSNKSVFWFCVWVALGTTFHKSAVLLLPIAALASARNRYWIAFWVGLTALVCYNLLVADEAGSLYENYVVAAMQSGGALVRLLMNVLPAIVLLIWLPKFGFDKYEARLWRWFALVSLVFLGLFMVTPASTALDRVALYLLPLQLVVFARLPGVLSTPARWDRPSMAAAFAKRRRFLPVKDSMVTATVLLYYGVVEFVWLNYGTYAFAWLPYRFYPLDSSF